MLGALWLAPLGLPGQAAFLGGGGVIYLCTTGPHLAVVWRKDATLFGTLGGPLYLIMIVVTEAEIHHSECGSKEDEEPCISTLESSLPDNTVP